MLFRAVCFVAATLLFHGAARWFAIGVAIMLPWLAVVLANAPTAASPSTPPSNRPRRGSSPAWRPAREPRIIDPD